MVDSLLAMLPLPIQKLPDDVINKIAAGEIIHRPSSALKELLENSIDAQATKLSVVLKDGGLKLLQVSDDGCGIRKEDFELVCERFATSKLTKFEDLETIDTFGFRGEALASITYVAHVSIVSMTRQSEVGYKCMFEDGKMMRDGKGNVIPPMACASNPGTIITVEDMFFNNDVRRKAMKNVADEYGKCLEVLTRYSIHYPAISFSCKKAGANITDLYSPGNSKTLDTIQMAFGKAVARELLSLEIDLPNHETLISGYVSNPNFNMKKLVFILFINHRLVDSASIKKAVEQCYVKFVPKNTHPFLYLSLIMNPRNVDVNVHPTKREVIFLRESEIISLLLDELGRVLENSNQSRSFQTHFQLPLSNFSTPPASKAPSQPSVSSNIPSPVASVQSPSHSFPIVDSPRQRNGSSQLSEKRKNAPSKMMRADSLMSQLDSYMLSSNVSSGSMDFTCRTKQLPKQPPTDLTSVKELVDEIDQNVHPDLRDVLRQHIFVGCVDDVYSIVQFGTKLYLLNMCILSNSFFYECAIRSFSGFKLFAFEPPLSITDLIQSLPPSLLSNFSDTLDVASFSRIIAQELLGKREMLLEYFSIEITSHAQLKGIPKLCENYKPSWLNLPLFLVRLARRVDWSEEKSCFECICRELALLYQLQPEIVTHDSCRVEKNPTEVELQNTNRSLMQYSLLPYMKSNFSVPQVHATDSSIIQIAALEQLYKIFERC